MTDLRIDTGRYQLQLIAPGKRLPVKGALQHGAETKAEEQPVSVSGERRPPFEPPALPGRSIGPALAARIYQANIPTETYIYPFHTTPDEEGEPGSGGGHDRQRGHPAVVTLMHYEPGILVDCYG